MIYPLKFNPVYKDYMWGGRNLEKLNKNIPKGIVAESWELSTHKDGVTTIGNGKFKGKLATEVFKEYGEKILGKEIYKKYNDLPILIKFIDAQNNLSVQVHPDDDYASKYEDGQNGKTEMWYIVEADKDAQLIYGLKQGITKDIFKNHIEKETVEECLNYINGEKGDLLNIPAGTVHAIGKGILIVEIQQKSNLTYRVYDYNRTDKYGKKRELHIDKALDVISFNNNKLKKCKNKEKFNKCLKEENKYFNVEEFNIMGILKNKSKEECCHVFVFLEGEGTLSSKQVKLEVKKGDTVLIPAYLGEYVLQGNMKLLRVDIL